MILANTQTASVPLRAAKGFGVNRFIPSGASESRGRREVLNSHSKEPRDREEIPEFCPICKMAAEKYEEC